MADFNCDFDEFENPVAQETEQVPVLNGCLSDDLSDDLYNDLSNDFLGELSNDVFDDLSNDDFSIFSNPFSSSQAEDISVNETSVPMSPPPPVNSDTKPHVSNAIQISFVDQQSSIESGITTSYNPNQLGVPVIPLDCQKGKKKIYGRGSEVEKLKRRNADYLSKEDYRKLEVFKGLGSPTKKFINELGVEYNLKFKEKIDIGEMDRYGRDQKRNLKCAVIFFQKRLPKIYFFLVDHGFNKINSF